jgi:hypothetical protein
VSILSGLCAAELNGNKGVRFPRRFFHKSRDGLLFVAIKFPESLIVNDTLGI